MVAATVIAIFIIPVTFYVSERFLSSRTRAAVLAPALAPIQGGSDDAPCGEGDRP